MENKNLIKLIKKLEIESNLIDEDRKKLLRLVSDLIYDMIVDTGQAEIVIICTHNSRRSQLAEAWIVAATQYYGIRPVRVYSGGTEATQFNIRMVVALRQSSFHLRSDGPRDNPMYTLEALRKSDKPHIMFSKVYDHPSNPREEFMAFMVCSQADQNCPLVQGASHRISLPFNDPKDYDDTPMENDAYLDKVNEVGREMIYLIKQLKLKN